MRHFLVCFGCYLLCYSVVSAQSANPITVLQRYSGHQEAVYSQKLSPDGKLLVTGSFDRTLKVFDITTGKELRTFAGQQGHQGLVLGVDITPDGQLVASAASDNTVKIWDMLRVSPNQVFNLTSAPSAFALNPDGKAWTVAESNGKLKSLLLKEKMETVDWPQTLEKVTAIATAPNNQHLVTVTANGMIDFWNLPTKERWASFRGQKNALQAVTFNTGGNQFFTASDTGEIVAWQIPEKAYKEVQLPKKISKIIPNADQSSFLALQVDGTARILKIGSNENSKEIKFPTREYVSLAFNATNLFMGYADGKVWSGSFNDGKTIGPVQLQPSAIQAMAIHPGNQLITGGKDGKVRVFKLPLPEKIDEKKDAPIRIWDTQPGGVVALNLSNNGSEILTATKENQIKLWDVGDPRQGKRDYGTFAEGIVMLSPAKDFSAFAVLTGKRIRLLQIGDGKEYANWDLPHPVQHVHFASDRNKVAILYTTNELEIYQTNEKPVYAQGCQTKEKLHWAGFIPNQNSYFAITDDRITNVPFLFQRRKQLSTKSLTSLSAMSNGQYLLATGVDGETRAINPGNLNEEKKFNDIATVAHAVTAARNSQVMAVGGADQIVRLYRVENQDLVTKLTCPAPIRSLSFHPNNQYLAAGLENGKVMIWNVVFQPGQPFPAEFGRTIQEMDQKGSVQQLVFDEKNHLYTIGSDSAVQQWKLASEQPLRNLQHPQIVDCLAIDPSGKQVATGNHDGILRLWDLEKGQIIKSINAHPFMANQMPQGMQPPPITIYSVQWSLDGKQVVTSSYDRSIKLWEIASGNLIREFKPYTEKTFEKGHRDQVFATKFSKDGNYLFSAGSDRTIKIWEIATGNVIRELTQPIFKYDHPVAHPGWIYQLELSMDGTQLIAAGAAPKNRGYLSVWSWQDGKVLYAKELEEGPIHSVILSKTGTELFLGCGVKDRFRGGAEAIKIAYPK